MRERFLSHNSDRQQRRIGPNPDLLCGLRRTVRGQHFDLHYHNAGASVNALLFIVSLALIFVGSSLFTNGVEWIGRKFNLSEGVVGSVLAAVGTALPETIVPLIAIFFVAGTTGQDVGMERS